MRFPQTSAALFLYMDPAQKFVAFNQFAYPTLQIQSVVNRATEVGMIQTTTAAQPVWSSTAIAGTYVARNNPEATGMPGLVFAGAQYIEHDAIATALATAETAFSTTCTVAPGVSNGTIWSLCDGTSGYYVSLAYTSGTTLAFKEVNSNGTYTTSVAMTAASVHVVSTIRSANILTLRVDGAVAGSPATVTAGTAVPSKFIVGALNASGSLATYFNGTLGKLAVFKGSADIDAVETYMLMQSGIIRGPTSGTNYGF